MWHRRIDTKFGFRWVARKSGNRFIATWPLFNSRQSKMTWFRWYHAKGAKE